MLEPLLLVLGLACGSQESSQDALAQSRALLERGAVEEAIQVLEAGREARPGDARLERALAQTFERFVDEGGALLALSDARAAWDRACALEPNELETQRGAIAVLVRLGEYEEALALAERALGAAWLSGGSAPPVLLELACRARLGALPPRESETRPA